MDRDQLLDAAIDYAAREGLADFSLRACAASIGTSHRMLGYHFGTKDDLLTAIIDAVSQRQRALIDDFVAARDPNAPPPTSPEIDASLRALLVDDENLRFVGLLGEATYRVARHPGRHPGAAPTYAAILDLWAPQLTALYGLTDLPPEQQAARTRLAVAVMVGLSLDYLGTGDVEGYVAASREWLRLNLGG